MAIGNSYKFRKSYNIWNLELKKKADKNVTARIVDNGHLRAKISTPHNATSPFTMNTFYNLNTNFVRIHGDSWRYIFCTVINFSYLPACPPSTFHHSLRLATWKRFLTILSLKVQQHWRQQTWANFSFI